MAACSDANQRGDPAIQGVTYFMMVCGLNLSAEIAQRGLFFRILVPVVPLSGKSGLFPPRVSTNNVVTFDQCGLLLYTIIII